MSETIIAGETMSVALLNTVIGLITVFGVLLLFVFLISLFKYIPGVTPKSNKKDSEPDKEGIGNKIQIWEPTAETGPSELIKDKELAAVIMAAIMAAQGTGPGAVSADRLVVRSIKRVSKRR